jgi:hypothetical protein
MNSAAGWKRAALAFARVSALVFAATANAQVQTTTDTATGGTTRQVKVVNAEVVAVSGNDVVVKMEDGSLRHIASVPDSARVTVDGKELGVHDLKPGMRLQNTITTTTSPKLITTTKTVTGKVWHVNPPLSVILTLEDGTNQEFKIPKGQKFTVNGEQVDAFGLKKGMIISATKVVEEPITVVEQQAKVTGSMPPPPPAPPADQPMLVAVVSPAPAPAAAPAALPNADDESPTAPKKHPAKGKPPTKGPDSAVSNGSLDQAEENAIITAAKNGVIQYNVPPTMIVGRQVTVQVEIDGAKCSEKLRQEFQATGSGTLKVITPMQVQLSAPDNPEAFKIEADPIKSGNLFLPENGKALWVFYVTPKQGGREPKKLKIDAYMVFDKKLPSGLPETDLIWSYTAQVPVRVETMRIVSDFISKNWDKLLGFILPSGAGVALIVWLLSRRKKQKQTRRTVLHRGAKAAHHS